MYAVITIRIPVFCENEHNPYEVIIETYNNRWDNRCLQMIKTKWDSGDALLSYLSGFTSVQGKYNPEPWYDIFFYIL